MPLKLIKGCTYTMVRESIAKHIVQNLSLDTKNYLVVPDDIVATAKREFVKLIDKNSIFGLKVLGFAELANEFVEISKQSLPKELGQMIFKSVMCENKKNLKSFALVSENEGALNEIFNLIGTLRESNIATSQLVNAVTLIGGMLGEKVADIAMLYEKYCDKINEHYCDNHIKMHLLVEHFKNCGKLQDCNFYFCDFGLMYAEQLQVLESIVLADNNVFIGAVANGKANNKRIYPRFLIDFCKKISLSATIKVEIEQLEINYLEDKNILVSNLFGYDATSQNNIRNYLSIFSGENINLEIKGICRMIRKLIVEEGARFNQINIFCPDVDKYKSEIAREFAIFEIPYFLQAKTSLATFAVARLLIDGISTKKSCYQKSNMLAFSKNILLGLNAEDVNCFELFVNKYNIEKELFLKPFEGISGEPLLDRAEIVRKRLIDILQLLDLNLEDKVQAIECIQNFYQYIFDEYPYSKYLQKLQINVGEDMRRNAELALNSIFEILDIVKSANMAFYFDVFDSVISLVKNKSIGASKQYVDNLFITSNPKEINNSKYLFVIGANDGVLAPESSTISLFTCSELEQLEKSDVQFCPNIMDINYNSKFEIVQLLAKGEKVFVSFCQEGGEPALVVKNICDMFGIKVQPLVSDSNKIGMNYSKYAMKIGTKCNVKRELSLYYSERMRGIATGEEDVFEYLYTNLKGEYAYQNLIKPKNFEYVKSNDLCWSKSKDKTYASISALERYFDCPFKFYCERTLRLKKVQTGGLDVMAMGNFVHRILEHLFGEYKSFDMTAEELFEIVDKLCAATIKESDFEVLSLCMSQNVLKNSLFKKVHFIAEKLIEIAKRSEFEREYTELTFGFDYSKLPPYQIKSGDKSYFIRGKIDRIDKYGDYVAIIDYKTSSSVDYSLKEIYYGERVQLLIYLNAYMANSENEPFALFYMPLPYSYSSDEEGKLFGYTGLIRNLESVFPHFDCEYQNKSISSIPIKFKKNGELNDKGLLSKSDLQVLLDYADKVVVQAIAEIESGYIEAKPTNCAGCEYGEICLNKNNPSKTRKKLSKTAFSITEEAEEDGED